MSQFFLFQMNTTISQATDLADRRIMHSTDQTEKSSQVNVTMTTPEVRSTELSLHFIVYTVINSMFCLLGILGNILVVLVYWKRKDKMAARIYTLVLAFIDLFSCIGSMSLAPVVIGSLMTKFQESIYMKYLTFMVYMSVLVLLSIAVDRYYAVYKPMEFNMNSKKKALLSLFIIVPVSVFFMIGKEIGIEDMIYFTLTALTLGGCFIAVSILYAATFWKLYKRNKVHNSTSQNSYVQSDLSGGSNVGVPRVEAVRPPVVEAEREGVPSTSSSSWSSSEARTLAEKRRQHQLRSTARMFAVVTLIFVLSYVPPLLVNQRLIPQSWYLQNAFYLNHISNPVIYMVFNKTFRQELIRLISQ